MRFKALALDYDGTLAWHGEVDEATVAALQRAKDSGRKLLMVTGREVPELLVFNKIDRLPPGEGARLARVYGASAVSAQTGTGLMELIERADAALFDASASAEPALREASSRG